MQLEPSLLRMGNRATHDSTGGGQENGCNVEICGAAHRKARSSAGQHQFCAQAADRRGTESKAPAIKVRELDHDRKA